MKTQCVSEVKRPTVYVRMICGVIYLFCPRPFTNYDWITQLFYYILKYSSTFAVCSKLVMGFVLPLCQINNTIGLSQGNKNSKYAKRRIPCYSVCYIYSNLNMYLGISHVHVHHNSSMIISTFNILTRTKHVKVIRKNDRGYEREKIKIMHTCPYMNE